MNRGWVLALLMPVAAHAEVAASAVETFVLVGEKIGVEALPDPCEDDAGKSGERRCFSFDALFQARYRVVEPLVGRWPEATITFKVADHYGFPSFGHARHALLFVAVGPQGAWLHKYQGIPLLRTDDGGWAHCGGSGSGDGPRARNLRFSEDLGPVAELPPGQLEALRRTHSVRIRKGRVACLRGIPVAEVYEHIRSGTMQARGEVLPPWNAHAPVP